MNANTDYNFKVTLTNQDSSIQNSPRDPNKINKEVNETIKEVAIDILSEGDLKKLIAIDQAQLTNELKHIDTKKVNKGFDLLMETPEFLAPYIYSKLIIGGEDSKDSQSIFVQLSSSNPTQDELVIITDILSILDQKENKKEGINHLGEILRGAHVRINDGGELYDKWSKLETAHERISSHPSIKNTKQYGVAGPWTHEILFGVVEVNGKKTTFFQTENTPWMPGAKNRLGHTTDAFIYVLTKKNIGPYGSSGHTDKNAIEL